MATGMSFLNDTEPSVTLYVVIPPSPLFAAHWSFFIPSRSQPDPISRRCEESNIGRRIHVSGDRLNGFTLEIIRRYDIKKHRGVATRQFAIGLISEMGALPSGEDEQTTEPKQIKDEIEGGGWVDNDPRDMLEEVCVGVEAPGPGLNRVVDSHSDRATAGEKPKAVEVRDCQWWIRQVVQVLSEKCIIKALKAGTDGVQPQTPCQVVASLPTQ